MSEHAAIIKPGERFDFNSYRQIRDMYEPALANPKIKMIVVDLGSVLYIDSAALGVLLLLRNKATELNKRVDISNAKGTVKEVLEIANFDKLFKTY